LGVFIRSNKTKEYLIACLWPHDSYLVDFNQYYILFFLFIAQIFRYFGRNA
jgi:hypothetical protein